MKVWSGPAGEIASGRVDDLTGDRRPRPGPGRRSRGRWPAADAARSAARRSTATRSGSRSAPSSCSGSPTSAGRSRLRNLDLLVAALVLGLALVLQPRPDLHERAARLPRPLVYLLARTVWIGFRGRPPPASPPALAGLAAGRRDGLPRRLQGRAERRDSNVIDVGYVGRDRRAADRRRPVAVRALPGRGRAKACAPADREGEIRHRIQTNGRCESANPNGDTYGPVVLPRLPPRLLAIGWSGKWDDLPAAHFTSIVFDLLCLLGLGLVGRRFGGNRLGVTLAFAWAAYPFTQYVSNSNTNDAIMPAFLIWGFWLSHVRWARGAFVALAGWTKFAALIVAPLWATYPECARPRGRALVLRGGVRRWRRVAALLGAAARAEPAARGARLLGPDDPARRSSRALAVLALGLAPVPRRAARPARRSSRCSRSLLVAGAVAVAFLPAAEVAAPARRADRRAADRLRARPHPLVLPLPAVVLRASSRTRCSRPAADARAGARRRSTTPMSARPRELVPAG